MLGADVQENGTVALGGLQIALAHHIHRHFAEFRPAEGRRGAEGTAAGAIHYAEQAEDLRRFGGVGIADVVERGAVGRAHGQDQQSCKSCRGKGPGQNTFTVHALLSFALGINPHAVLPPAGGRWP